MITRRFTIAALTACILGLCQGKATADSQLTRLLSQDALEGWESVGRINVVGGGFCTGILVAPDLVLTAAHCLYHPRSRRRVSDERIHFVAGLQKGSFVAHSRARRTATVEGYQYDHPNPFNRIRLDLALVELLKPVPSEKAEVFPISPQPEGTVHLAVVSYGKGRSEVPALQDSCRKLPSGPVILQLSCSITFGSSGAPVFVASDGRPRIVAIISSLTNRAGQEVALAVPVQPNIEGLLSALGRSLDDQKTTR